MTARRHSQRVTSLLSRLIPLSFILGCGTEPMQPATPDAGISSTSLTLARDVQPLLNENCTRCHALAAPEPHGNPHFTPDVSRASLATTSACTSGGARVALVVPGKPEDSFLMYKLGAPTNLTISGSPCTDKMPIGGDGPFAETDPELVARIRQWILDGAR